MRFGYFLCLSLLVFGKLFASSDVEYPITGIADSLKRNAGAVVRLDNVTIEIQDIHGYTYSEEKVISVLNSSQEELAGVTLFYDEQRDKIKNFSAWVFDADGKMVKHFGKSDGADLSATPGYVLVGNERVKYWDLKRLKPPYTVEFSYTKEVSGTFQLPEWLPAPTVGVSIEKASLHVNCGDEVLVNHQVSGLPDDTVNTRNFLWQVSGFCAIKKNDFSPAFLTMLPHVLLMAKSFELYGHKGSSRSWDNIGLFMNTLMKDREDLNAVEDPKLKDIINLNVEDKEKVKLIYKYLQSNFRYVCISLGIGGWQPQEASFTMQKKYGDCKALSLVMKAMLKKAGIESCLTLITAGDGQRIELTSGFPHSYFNHAILCVPLPNDTIWLECTSQTSPFNYLGKFTSNRRALMIFDGGARVLKTPVYAEKDNISHSRSVVNLNADNSVSIKSTVGKQGEFQDDLRGLIDLKDAKNIESALYAGAHLKSATLNSYAVTRVEPDEPVILFTLDLTNEGTIRPTESRLFIKTDIFAPVTFIPDKNEYRTQKVHVNTGYTQCDTITYNLPKGYVPESFKATDVKEISEQFGYANTSVTYSVETGELQLIRKFCLKHATYPAADYNALREFLLKASKQCCPELVLKKM